MIFCLCDGRDDTIIKTFDGSDSISAVVYHRVLLDNMSDDIYLRVFDV